MGKIKKSETGFSPVEVVLALVIVALIGVVGFMVYNNHNNKPTTNTIAPTTTTKPATTKTDTPKSAIPTTPFVNVIQDNSSITQETPEKIGKTADQIAILTALHNTCTGSNNYVTVDHAVFDGTLQFEQEGNYAAINATVCSPLAKARVDLGVSWSGNILHKNSSGTWILDSSSQMAPNCAKVDGLGYPSSILDICYDGSTARAPR